MAATWRGTTAPWRFYADANESAITDISGIDIVGIIGNKIMPGLDNPEARIRVALHVVIDNIYYDLITDQHAVLYCFVVPDYDDPTRIYRYPYKPLNYEYILGHRPLTKRDQKKIHDYIMKYLPGMFK